MRELENVFHVPVIEAYGMTEAAHQICSNPLPPGERKAGSVGVPAGPQVSIMDEDGRLLPSGKVGEVVIRGANVMRGYANDSDGSFTNGWFRTGDQGYLNDDGYLFITGRLKEIINRGGEKISPREIDDIILEHPSIMEAVTFGISHATLGEDVATVVVLRKQVATTELELQQFVASRLADFKVPRQIIIVDAIPKAATGKVQRVGLAGKLGLVDRHEELATPRTVFDTPRTQTENALTRIWSAVLGLDVGLEDNFFHLGGNSIHTAQIISRVRESFGVELSFPTFFEAPAVAAMARAIDGLTATKLAETIRTTVRSGHKFEAPSIVPGPRDANLPLSFAQQRMWFLDQLEPNSAIYNVPSGLRLTGPLDSDVLERSLNEIIRRHEVLRTIFPNVGGQAVQVILPSLVIPLPLVDVSDRSESDRKHAIRDLGTEESQRPFDLARGPLIRATLLRLNYQDHVLFLTLHHIVFDGWSRGVLFHDLLTLYEALSNGKPSRLEELSIQYADFAVWQRGWLQGEVLEAQLSYWKKQLTSVPPLQLPTDRPRPVVQGYRGTRQSMALSEELTEALKNLSQQESVTLFMTLLAAFQTLLSRYTGQEDIAVGTDMANRNRIETEGLIGFFVNLLVIRTDLSRNPTFRELLRHVRALIMEAYSHQDLPFDKLVEELKPQRDRSRNPLVQVLLVFQNFPVRTQEIRDLTVSPIDVDSKIARFDLVLFTDFKDRQLVTTWNYNTDLFEPSTISRMMNHFKTLLVNIVAQPDARLKELEFVSETERNQGTMKDAERRELKMRSLRTARRKKIEISGSDIVKTDYFKSGGALPLIVQPAIDDVDIVEWVTDNIDVMEKELLKHGAILFRGFGVSSVSQFQEFALAFCPELYGDYGDLPRQSAGARVYESTPYPADQAILFHNESAHMHRWPLKQWFFCAHPPQLRGETPIVDCRRVYDSINPVIRERFAQKQIMYVRNFTNKLDVSWQDFFKTADRSVVENSCRNASIDFEWKKDDTLQTRQVCPAVARHPKTSETVWFNQLQHWHLACLDQATRESLLSIFREQDLPRNCYYGDGSAIEDSVIEEIGDVYRKTAVSFPWQQGDILMVDNMLVAHARNPYVGTRKILVAMGEMVNKEVISYNI
jgi:alpha-ketoglutarate-dependent taurine dioxygenase